MQKIETLPAIVRWGERFVGEFGVNEYEDSLRRAFVDDGADFVLLDSNMNGQKFRAAAAAWAISHEILWFDASVSDGQSQVSKFRLTDYGKTYICNPSTPVVQGPKDSEE